MCSIMIQTYSVYDEQDNGEKANLSSISKISCDKISHENKKIKTWFCVFSFPFASIKLNYLIMDGSYYRYDVNVLFLILSGLQINGTQKSEEFHR